MDKCDVIVVTYNRQPYLKELLSSISSEAELIGRVVVYDDVSNDGTLDYLYGNINNFPFEIIVIENQTKSKSVGRSRNVALDYVTSDYVVVLDDDDVFPPYKIRKTIELMKNSGGNWVIGSCIEFSENSEAYIPAPKDYKKSLFGTNNIRWATTGFRSSVLKEVGFDEDVKIITDWVLYCDLIHNGYEPIISERCLAFYRLHPGAVSRKYNVLLDDFSQLKCYENYKDFNIEAYQHRTSLICMVQDKLYFKALRLHTSMFFKLGLYKFIRFIPILLPGFIEWYFKRRSLN
ncbi:glycosyltransferase family 2 protein [Neptuniibacter sp. QD48_55]|uniref:glycosyltransferase family 2 protein n=1 Tax=Neptuniibacter sp. QD48_55 TaxID=3398212 RepID=UPI0039F64448